MVFLQEIIYLKQRMGNVINVDVINRMKNEECNKS